MLKIFAPKVIDRVNIGYIGNVKISQELNQAKGVMNNYLRDKHFTVDISAFEQGDEFINIRGLADSQKSSCIVPIKKDGNEPLLRRVYRTIEMFAKDPVINTKK